MKRKIAASEASSGIHTIPIKDTGLLGLIDGSFNLELTFALVSGAIQSKDYQKALLILDDTIKDVEAEKSQQTITYADDKTTEYHHFYNILEFVLYKELCKPSKEVRQVHQDFTQLYFLQGFVLYELELYADARKAFQKVLKWNPVFTRALFEIGETYKQEGKMEKFYEITVKCFDYAYTRQDIARCYRNLGFYYIERANYDLAGSLFIYSLFWAEAPIAHSELAYISLNMGKTATPLSYEEMDRIFKVHQIPTRPDTRILSLVTDLAEEANKAGDADAVKFYGDVLDNLTPEKSTQKSAGEKNKAKQSRPRKETPDVQDKREPEKNEPSVVKREKFERSLSILDEDFDVEKYNDTGNMPAARCAAVEAASEKLIELLETGELTRDELSEFLKSWYYEKPAEAFDRYSLKDLFEAYRQLELLAVDDDGNIRDYDEPYLLNGEHFCCRRPMKKMSNGTFQCRICGKKSGASKRASI